MKSKEEFVFFLILEISFFFVAGIGFAPCGTRFAGIISGLIW
jgi:hypothetical protein